MSHDIISDALNQIMNAKKAGKEKVEINRISKVLINVFELIKKEDLIDFKVEGKKIEVEIKNLDECKSIKPRFNVKVEDLEKYERRFLPAKGVGIIIISTNKGLMSHEEAEKENLGGSLIAYFF